MRFVLALAASGALVACGNTYHPEYHPVSIRSSSQNLSYPVSVHNGGNPAERSPVIIAPAPPPPAPAPAPPPVFVPVPEE